MKKPLLKIAAPSAVALAFVLLANPSNAATVLVNESWQANNVTNDLRLDDTTTEHVGWKFIQGGNNIFKNVDTPANGLPGGADGTANQALQFEWSGANAEYDTGHTWASDDQFSLSFNATEMNWGNANNRFILIELTETSRDGGGNLVGAPVWSQIFELTQYDTAHDAAAEDWSAAQTFNVNFSGADFSGGTPGSALTFEVGGIDPAASSAGRGAYIDNINFSLVPEPTSLALLGLGGLSLIFRRRR